MSSRLYDFFFWLERLLYILSSAKAFFDPTVQKTGTWPQVQQACNCQCQLDSLSKANGDTERSHWDHIQASGYWVNWACGSVKLATSDTLLPLLSQCCSLVYFHTCILGLQDSGIGGKGSLRTVSLCKSTGVGHPWGGLQELFLFPSLVFIPHEPAILLVSSFAGMTTTSFPTWFKACQVYLRPVLLPSCGDTHL